MLYVFHGTDTEQAAKKAHTLADSLRAKKPDAAFEQLGADDWNTAVIESHLGGQGLFSNKYIVFLDRLTENLEAKEKLSEFAAAMNESDNIFIVLEGKINAELKRAFDKHAAKVVECEKKATGAGATTGSWAGARAGDKEFNVFALGDALGSRDKFRIWSLYRQGIENGLEPENILGTLFWQLKSIMLASKAKTAAEAGLNPFVFSKSKRYAANFSAEEMQKIIFGFITLYHDGHRGLVNMELGMERMLIS